MAATVGLLCSVGTALAVKKIPGKRIVNGSIGAKKLKPTLRDQIKGAGGTTQGSQQGPQGPPGSPGQSGIATYENPQWGIIDRNTIGSAVADLRSGPFVLPAANGSPPFGDGSLGIQTSNDGTTSSDPAEKASFGNQVDFVGDPVLGINAVGFRAFQTGENNAISTSNVPSITFEIDPNMASTATNFSSMVWAPAPTLASNQWSGYLDATSTGSWFLTGTAGTAGSAKQCTQASPCTFAEVKTRLDDGGDAPAILTFAVTKGRDYTYSGAVDGLRLNDVVYDFEPFGVTERAP